MWNKEYKRMQSGVKFEEDCCPLSNMKIISCVRFELDFSRSDFHPKKEHSRSYVTDEGGNMDRKDFQR